MEKNKKYTYFIGVDISRNKLDFAIMCGSKFLFHKETNNNVIDIKSFVSELKQLSNFTISKAAFCMEQTGVYSGHLKTALKSFKANIIIEDALQIRSTLGIMRGKYDKIDSIRIASYGYKNRECLRVWQPRRKIIDELAHLATLRERLIGVKITLTQQLNEDIDFISKKIVNSSKLLCQNSTSAVKNDLINVEAAISNLIDSDPEIKRKHEIILSVPSLGTVTAVQIIITTNELKDIHDPKKYACYAGVAPFRTESGIAFKKAKVSHLANKRVKALLHNCAINAMRFDPELKAYFEKKHTVEGKHKMLVLNALRNKIILRVFACLNQDRLYENSYSTRLTKNTFVSV